MTQSMNNIAQLPSTEHSMHINDYYYNGDIRGSPHNTNCVNMMPISHLTNSSSLSNLSCNQQPQFMHAMHDTTDMALVHGNPLGRTLEHTGRSISSENAFQQHRSPGSSCSDYSVFSNSSLYDSNTQIFCPLEPTSLHHLAGTSQFNPHILASTYTGQNTFANDPNLKHLSCSMPGLDRVNEANMLSGLPLRNIVKRKYGDAVDDDDLVSHISSQSSHDLDHINLNSSMPHRRSMSSEKDFMQFVNDPTCTIQRSVTYSSMGVGQELDKLSLSLDSDPNNYALRRVNPMLNMSDDIMIENEHYEHSMASNEELNLLEKSEERPQKKRRQNNILNSISKSTPNLKKGEKSESTKQKSNGGSVNSSKKKLFDRNSKSDMNALPSDVHSQDIADVYLQNPAYYQSDMHSINYLAGSIPTVYASPSCQNNIGNLSRPQSETLSQVPCTDGTIKSFNRTPNHLAGTSYDITNSFGGISMVPSYSSAMPNSFLDLKPDPDEIENNFSQLDMSGSYVDGGNSGSATLTREPNYDYQALKWMHYPHECCKLIYDESHELVVPTEFKVVADKGFHYSFQDDAFICQKKNHFQVSVTFAFSFKPIYIIPEENDNYTRIKKFALHLNGMRLESETTWVNLEKSQTDRSKIPFDPFELDISPNQLKKVTLGKLHFSETTANNMRKKGKPNPDQRFFSLVVALHAYTDDRTHFPVIMHKSDKIIVRASNPSQFESDTDFTWTRCASPDAIYHSGRVGINVDHPDEALVVNGNFRLTGQLLKLSDERCKEEITHVDTCMQLEHISKLNIYDYNFKKEFCSDGQIVKERGFLAQEVKNILPNSVYEYKKDKHENSLLMINKDSIYVESVGAVQELNKRVEVMSKRLDALESANPETTIKKYSLLRRLFQLSKKSFIFLIFALIIFQFSIQFIFYYLMTNIANSHLV